MSNGKIISGFLVGLTFVGMGACNREADAPGSTATPTLFQQSLGKVYLGYLGMQAGLARDDLAAAKTAFMSMHGVLHAMPVASLDSASKARWTTLDGKMMEALHPIAATEDIEEFRKGFAVFSIHYIAALESFGVSSSQPILLYHCPMARDGKGADWLQKEAEPHNPYYGASMLDCGEKVRTF